MREKLIELLCEAHSKSAEETCFNDATYAQQLEMEADHLIANGVTIQKWISVTERLPDQYHKVFMAGRNGGVFIGERTSGTTAVADGHCRGFTHWMELPKAPKED